MMKIIAANIEDAMDQIERACDDGLIKKSDRDQLAHDYDLLKLDAGMLLEQVYKVLDDNEIEESY